MMQAWWLFCICSVLFFVVSLTGPPPKPEQIEGLCWESPLAALSLGRFEAVKDPRLIAGVLVATMVALYAVFR